VTEADCWGSGFACGFIITASVRAYEGAPDATSIGSDVSPRGSTRGFSGARSQSRGAQSCGAVIGAFAIWGVLGTNA